MSYSHEYDVPVIIGTGAVLTQGDTSNLVGGQIGLFINGSNGYTTVKGQLSSDQDVLIASGSWHKKDKLNKFWGGLKESDKTVPFLGKDVLSFERSRARKAQSEQWVIGWDGINDCDTLSYECGKTYRYKVRVWGEDVYGTFLRPIDRFVSITTDCCDGDDCSESCQDGVGCKKWSKKLAEAINNDPELGYFVRAEAISSDYAPTTPTHKLYQLSVLDNGDPVALAAVQTAYPGINIQRVERNGIQSVYEFCQANGVAAPANFTPTADVLLAVCGTCPTGFTTNAAQDVYVVNRPLAGTETLVTGTNKQTYANTIRTAYSAVSARFLSQNGSTASVELTFAVGANVAALAADNVSKISVRPATCSPSAPAAIAWVVAGDRYKLTRTLCMSLEKTCGGTDRLAELQAFYANNTQVVPNSLVVLTAGECGDTYQIQQYNNDCLVDGCLTEAIPEFDTLQSFEGYSWDVECPCADETTATDTLCGVRIEAAYEETKFGGCTFSPMDYYNIRPLKLEITEFDDSGMPCRSQVPSRKIRNSSMATQSGEFVKREYIKSNVYKAYGQFYHDPRMREVLDAELHEVIDASSFYNIYYLKIRQNRGNMNGDYKPEIFEFRFAFREGIDTTAFESLIGNFTSQYGIYLKDR